MQKILSILLVIVMMFSVSATAFAAELPDTTDTDTSIGASIETTSDEETTEELSSDAESLIDEETPPDEELPELEEICLCDPTITDEDGIHDNPDCPFYIEAEPLLPIQLMAAGNNLWSDTGNYNANWPGLTDYATTTDFYITDAADLAAFTISLQTDKNKTYAGKTVTLTSDIDLSAHLWDMRGGISRSGGNGNVFSGTFDGGGHTITGMTIDYDNSYIGYGSDFGGFGLFASLYKATVKNLTMRDSALNIGYFVASFPFGAGVVAGQSAGSTFENVNVYNAVITQKENNQGTTGYIYFGGIVGTHYQPFTRFSPASLPSVYQNCKVDGLTISYTQRIDQNWQLSLGFGGIIGGDSTFNADKVNPYQTRIIGCTVNNFTLTRGAGIATAFCYEGYGGVIGFMDQPTIIQDTHVTNLLIDITNTATVNGSTFGYIGPASAMAGGLVGFAEVTPSLKGVYRIEASSAKGIIKAAANPALYPVYVGGLMGRNEGNIDCTDNYTELDFTNLLQNKNGKLIYGNLFGYLGDGADVRGNVFNNFDYTATAAEIDEPSIGYIGEKLSTFAACGEIGATNDLSQNWGILKNILTVGEKDYPLNYVQCTEKTADADFYDYWNVDSYSHAFLSQDSDTAQVTFSKDSGNGTFPVNAQISATGGAIWRYTKDIIVLPAAAQYYTVTYLPGTEGIFAPQEYTDLLYGDDTPAFDGTPIGNTGWLFDGWEPVVADTVTEDAVYTAQWKLYVPAPTGNLTISKTVTGNAGETDRDFTFKVDFTDNGTYNFTGSKSGTIKSGDNIALRHGQSVTIKDISVGVSYIVTETEANQNGYATTVANGTGTITISDITASFINHKSIVIEPDPTGNLTISKTVTGNAGDVNKDFTFKVTFSDGGTFAYTGSKSGTIKSGDTITLRHGQSVIIKDIPVGVSYSVVELEANQNGYTTTVTGGTGTIAVSGVTASFINHKSVVVEPDPTGNLIISKTVTGNAGDKSKDFTFKVTFSDGGTYNYSGSKSGTIKSGDTITLHHGQSVIITNIPVGVSYAVTELEANQNGYDTSVTGNKGIITEAGGTAAFINHKSENGTDPTGNLTISKTVTGNEGDTNKAFTFKVIFSGGGSYEYVGSKSGTLKSGGTVTLKHGQSITIINIPAGVTYAVSELEADKDGYKTTITGGSGIISADKTVIAAFVNDKSSVPTPTPTPTPDPDVPKTGDDFALLLWITLLSLSGIGILTAVIIRRRMKLKNSK